MTIFRQDLYPRQVLNWSVGFCGGRKTREVREPGEIPLKQGMN